MLLNQRSNAKTQEDMVKILHKRSQEYREMGRIFGAALAPAAPPLRALRARVPPHAGS